MDIAPSTRTIAKTRSSRARYGNSVKGSVAHRQPSPDSACENDTGWLSSGSGAISGPEDLPSDLSEEGGEKTFLKSALKDSSLHKNKPSEMTLAKVTANQDSDVDSGIVTCRPGQRIGSTSSADTDSSQDSRRKLEYSPPFQKSELSKNRSTGSLRVPKQSYGPGQSNGPIQADHGALKECNRRPPTPLSVFPDSHHCVRFDDQLQLSEQNIRRSCRKLFATLYAQRFSYPAHRPIQQTPLQYWANPYNSARLRSRTAPEADLRKLNSAIPSESFRYNRNQKENHIPLESRSSCGITTRNPSVHKSYSDAGVPEKISSYPHPYQYHRHQVHNQHPIEPNERYYHIMENGIPQCRSRSNSQCTCHYRLQKSDSEPSSHQANSSGCRPACRCCCGYPQQQASRDDRQLGLIKSNSCSTLTNNVLSHQSRPQLTQFPLRSTWTYQRRSVPQSELETKPKLAGGQLQKTSSCSNLLDKTSTFQVTNVPVYSDNMVHVYAQIASVVPSDLKSSPVNTQDENLRTKVLKSNYSTDTYDSLNPSSSVTLSSISSSSVPSQILEKASVHNTDNSSLDSEESKNYYKRTSKDYASTRNKMCNGDTLSVNSSQIYNQVSDNRHGSLTQRYLRDSRQYVMYSEQRPKSVMANYGTNHPYLKSALKKNTNSVNHQAIDTISTTSPISEKGSPKSAEVEYAVVDKSKKNRFASLPALNRYNSNSCVIEADDNAHPPVPPKKNLHKSDFSLYRSRSSSPKKTLLERVQTMTKNAKSALQKAFSTERIYRPEREERLEATGQKGLQRSRSLIRGITNSFRKKKKRSKTPLAEVVPQPSSDPTWDELPSGPNTPMHVRGQLLQLNLDGSQVVELTKPPSKPYGFFVARGRVRNSKGVFVSRMRDQETQKQLAGLLDIGDEILEIEGYNVKNSDIIEVNNLMAKKNTLLLTVLPYICRKDI